MSGLRKAGATVRYPFGGFAYIVRATIPGTYVVPAAVVRRRGV